MDKQIAQINRDVRNGKSLEENLPVLFNYMADEYYTYAGIQLAMHYDTFYEAYSEDGELWSKEARDMVFQINSLIKDNLLADNREFGMEKIIKQVDKIRNSIMKRMRCLTAYTDIFQIYEYILNRVEYRFKEVNELPGDDDFAREVLRYIFNSQDNMIINEKIKEIIGQLPIRMTKQKYFDLLRESIRPYISADRSSLDSYLYMLRTSSMLFHEKDMEKLYPKLSEQKAFFDYLKYKDITRFEYEKAEGILKEATVFLEREVSVYYSLQEIVNDLYSLLLCGPYAKMSVFEPGNSEEAVLSILAEINKAFISQEKKDLVTVLDEKFTKIEGLQEQFLEELAPLEDTLYEADKNYRKNAESIMLDKLLNVLLRTKDLLSNSLFIDWNETVSDKLADEETVEEETKKLAGELAELFAEHDRVIGRAIMANTLNKMPVFFHDHKEVMDYVRYSLEHCSDSYEKTACMEIINGIMSE